MRDTSFDKGSSDRNEKERDDNKGYEEKQAEKSTYNSGLSVFHSGLEDYFHSVRKTDSLLIEKKSNIE